MADENVQEIVRLARTDLNGRRPVADALTSIKGVGKRYANAVSQVAPIDAERKIGALSDDEMDALEEVITSPEEYGIPVHLRNRRKDLETGEDKHIIGADLDLAEEFDIRRLKEIDSYRGWRHKIGLPVRGQKTQSSFRSGGKVGVSRARVQEAAEEEEESEESGGGEDEE